MLQITIPASEQWDELKQEFVDTKEQTLQLEHSLLSLSKWESKWCKAFLGKQPKTNEETIDYIKCMTLTPNVKPEVYDNLTADNIKQINKYIEAPMTATTFTNRGGSKNNNQTVTSELIYCWMFSNAIPCEFQKWHLNRLLTLIRVCNEHNSPPKKMSKRDIMSQNAAINATRRAQLHTKG